MSDTTFSVIQKPPLISPKLRQILGEIKTHMSKYNITIDKNRCVGSTLCMMEAPDIFALDAEFQSHVIAPDTLDDEGVLAAAHACPMNAIFLVDKETGERVWPRN